ncbi:MAG: fasciclin domain-containing protein [Bacteroidales bacterium]|nr:fasciclin domain-containing protein [Bacteroidales bacterium]
MKRFKLLWVWMAILLFAQCKDDYWDQYYSRPEWLEPPIYEVLKNDGRFNSYLQLVDSTMYERILKEASFYTVFAPTDSAMNDYLKEQGYASIDEISAAEADTIVAYSLVYNVFEFDELTDVLTNGWDTLSSIKKKTAFYNTIYQEMLPDSTLAWVVDATANGSYSVGDNNYKYVPTYLDRIFTKRGLLPTDYEYFYPGIDYNGSNIQGAHIVTKNMMAENGIIHAVDKVNKPLPNLENVLESDARYSKMMAFFDRKDVAGEYLYKYYTLQDDVTQYFRDIYPDRNLREVLIKFYEFPVMLNAERVSNSEKEAETDGYTIFAPTNDAMDAFYAERIKPYTDNKKNSWTSLDKVPNEIMEYFMQAHMTPTQIWPSKYKNAMSYSGEFFNGAGVFGKSFEDENFSHIQVASNGLLYGTDKYIKSKYFETVYTQLLMDSSYTIARSVLDDFYEFTLKEELMRCALNGYNSEYYLVFVPKDRAFTNDGYTFVYSDETGNYTWSNANAAVGDITPEDRLKRLILSGIFVRINSADVNSTMSDMLTKGQSKVEGAEGYSRCFKEYGWDIWQNYYGDVVRVKVPAGAAKQGKLQIQSMGGFDATTTGTQFDVATLLKDMEFMNGKVYDMDARLIDYCVPSKSYNEGRLGTYVMNACDANKSVFSEYKKYAEAVLFPYDSDAKAYINPWEIDNTATVTVLIPNNDAMKQAVEDGYLPAYEAVTNTSSPTYDEDVAKAKNFLLWHILQGRVIPNDLNPHNVIYNYQTSTYLHSLSQETFYNPNPENPAQLPVRIDISKSADGNLVFATSPETSEVGGDSTAVQVILGAKNSNFYARHGIIHGIDGYLPCKAILQ